MFDSNELRKLFVTKKDDVCERFILCNEDFHV
jgi:hypothetical protein